jgi:transcriptional regulator with XRE-family HTH domain
MRSRGTADQTVLGTQLRKARETVGLGLGEVAERLGVTAREVAGWETGQAEPDLTQVEGVAELYRRGIDYFLKETPAPPTRIEFRSVTRRSLKELSPKARSAIAEFDELCRTALEIDLLTGGPATPSLPHVPRSESPVELARAQRRQLHCGDKPIRALREALRAAGIRVFQLVVPTDQFSGFSCWHSDYGPCILLNARELPGRRNFTLAHEYAHLLYRHAPSICDLKQEGRAGLPGDERSADLFAIEFLPKSLCERTCRQGACRTVPR